MPASAGYNSQLPNMRITAGNTPGETAQTETAPSKRVTSRGDTPLNISSKLRSSFDAATNVTGGQAGSDNDQADTNNGHVISITGFQKVPQSKSVPIPSKKLPPVEQGSEHMSRMTPRRIMLHSKISKERLNSRNPTRQRKIGTVTSPIVTAPSSELAFSPSVSSINDLTPSELPSSATINGSHNSVEPGSKTIADYLYQNSSVDLVLKDNSKNEIVTPAQEALPDISELGNLNDKFDFNVDEIKSCNSNFDTCGVSLSVASSQDSSPDNSKGSKGSKSKSVKINENPVSIIDETVANDIEDTENIDSETNVSLILPKGKIRFVRKSQENSVLSVIYTKSEPAADRSSTMSDKKMTETSKPNADTKDTNQDENIEVLGTDTEQYREYEHHTEIIPDHYSDNDENIIYGPIYDSEKFEEQNIELPKDDDDDEPIGVSPCGRFFKYDKEVGRGSFKTVYRGLDTQTGVAVAWCELLEKKLNKTERIRFR